jgi:hypothetical protein
MFVFARFEVKKLRVRFRFVRRAVTAMPTSCARSSASIDPDEVVQ